MLRHHLQYIHLWWIVPLCCPVPRDASVEEEEVEIEVQEEIEVQAKLDRDVQVELQVELQEEGEVEGEVEVEIAVTIVEKITHIHTDRTVKGYTNRIQPTFSSISKSSLVLELIIKRFIVLNFTISQYAYVIELN